MYLTDKLFALRARRAAFEFIGGENLDVLEEIGGGDGIAGCLRRKRRRSSAATKLRAAARSNRASSSEEAFQVDDS